MIARLYHKAGTESGVGLIEVMISVVIGMLLVLVIYQVYEVNEAQKRTITGGSDALQNAAYGSFLISRELSMTGFGIAPSADGLKGCPLDPASPGTSLMPMPAVIIGGASGNDPDKLVIFYGGSGLLSTPVQFKNSSTVDQAYQVQGPVAFNPSDLIVAAQGNNCTLSTIDPGGVLVDAATGFATLTHTPVKGSTGVTYSAVNASLVNLGPSTMTGRFVYTIADDCNSDITKCVLRVQNQLVPDQPLIPVISDVVNLKVQYGLDTDGDGIVDTWQPATGAWSPEALAALTPAQVLAAVQQLGALRVAIVTRSAQYEKDPVTTGPLAMFDGPNAVSMTLTDAQQHYRYKVFETMVPLRNQIWTIDRWTTSN